MDKYSSSKLAMYTMVKQIMEANESSRSGLPVLEEKYMLFREKLALLEIWSTELDVIRNGITEYKEERRVFATKKAVEIVAALKAYAEVEDLSELREAMKISKSELHGASRRAFLKLLDVIIRYAEENIANLTVYPITESDVTELVALKEELDDLLFTTTTSIIEHKVIYLDLKAMIKEVDALLKKIIDPLMIHFESADPHFFVSFKTARRLVGHHKQKGKSSEDPGANQNPIN